MKGIHRRNMGDNAAGPFDRHGPRLAWPTHQEDDMATNGSFYWNELMTRDAEAAKKFYCATLGWTFEPMEQGEGATYWLAKVGDESVAGIYSIEPNDQDTTEGWFAYVAVTDLSGALARATMGGGEVIREPFEVPGVGRIAIVNDNAGNTMGWMTPSE
jgi:predicted enzyme related to lactoylglutathione lyase